MLYDLYESMELHSNHILTRILFVRFMQNSFFKSTSDTIMTTLELKEIDQRNRWSLQEHTMI